MTTAPKAKPGAGQDSLLDPTELAGQRFVGRVESAVTAAVTAAQLDDVDGGGAALAVEVARAVDLASHRRDPYGVAAAARELREQLARLRLDPVSRDGTPTGDVEAFLRSLNEAT